MRKKFLCLCAIVASCVCVASDKKSVPEVDNCLQIRQRIVDLQKSIEKAELRQAEIMDVYPGDLMKMLDCYRDCLFANNVSCRVQMGRARKKEFVFGTYFVCCREAGSSCNNSGYGNNGDKIKSDKDKYFGKDDLGRTCPVTCGVPNLNICDNLLLEDGGNGRCCR